MITLQPPTVFEPRPDERVIHLTRGYQTLVSAHRYDFLNSMKWRVSFSSQGFPYAARSEAVAKGRRRSVFMHKLITSGPPGTITDHQDRNRMNNTDRNLIVCSRNYNNHNKNSGGVVGYKGVTYERRSARYRARFYWEEAELHLGNFITAEEAARAFDRKVIEVLGPFAVTNFDDYDEKAFLRCPPEHVHHFPEEIPF